MEQKNSRVRDRITPSLEIVRASEPVEINPTGTSQRKWIPSTAHALSSCLPTKKIFGVFFDVLDLDSHSDLKWFRSLPYLFFLLRFFRSETVADRLDWIFHRQVKRDLHVYLAYTCQRETTGNKNGRLTMSAGCVCMWRH
jgi:hypothetical protein